MDLLDRDVHRERRRILWQRVYSETLVAFIRTGQSHRQPECRLLAAQAVRDLDEWEARENAPKEDASASTGDPDRQADDDSDGDFLGR